MVTPTTPSASHPGSIEGCGGVMIGFGGKLALWG